MRHLLPLLPKPSRYLGIEPGSVHKDPGAVSLRVGLAFPDKYEVGMSYLGQKILYGVLNERANWQAERVFAPDLDAAEILRARETPLATMESDTPLAELAAIGFSITHELCYTNVLYILDLGGIPLRAKDRSADPGRWPLIMAGGGCTLAAEPLAPFLDIMFLGEGEDMMVEALEILERFRGSVLTASDREAMLREMARIPGVYVPEFFEAGPDGSPRPRFEDLPKPGRRIVPDLDDAAYPVEQVIPFGAVHNRLALEIARGCTRGCRFCQAGMTYRPIRERSVASLTKLMDSCLSGTGYGEVSFLSLSTGDFSALKSLFTASAARCREDEISLSLPALRVGSVDDDIMGQIAGIRRTGATLAPEAGSQRLRDVINKGVTENDLICHIQKLFEHGWQQIKLYFMIGLPTETDDDILAIADLCRKARDAAGPGIKRLQITAGVSPFVPKPHTPFQWEAQISREEIHRRIGLLLDALKKEKRISMRWHDPATSFLEGVFSRGDRRLAPVVERAYRKGAVFVSWMEHFSLAPWLEAMEEEGLSPQAYQAAIPLDAPLAWDHLENGVSREFLLRERANAHAGKTVNDCRYGTCLACGACDTKTPSLLPKKNASDRYANTLNFPQRDQNAHNPVIDEHGRVVPRDGWKKETAQPEGVKKRPPAISEHLTRKAMHLRLWYERKGLSSYLSQLELQSLFERALRRADVSLAFSQGFHPLPVLSFCRALPVGVASEGEWLTIHLRERRDPASVVSGLGRLLPGLIVTDAEILTVNRRPPESDADVFRLEYTGDDARRDAFAAAWRAIAARETIPWTRTTKKGEKETDVRVYMKKILFADDGACILQMSWETGYVSPLALVRASLAYENAGFDLSDFRLTKVRV
ncbi:MAG: TIGR03960 family B12-binding radical SAM protein [Deltaproteobacteria bacterium]|nr:TIGR03960 family B12-binding radical SAM protein [Deltaproteobacteria bacterium]